MKYLLDTDVSSYAIKGDRRVLAKMQQYLTQWAISSITYHELVEGMLGTKNPKNEKLFAEFIEEVDVIDFCSADAMESGRLSWHLAKAGTPIGEYDTLIAGHALSLNLTLVTNNEKHFSRVPELRIANWMK